MSDRFEVVTAGDGEATIRMTRGRGRPTIGPAIDIRLPVEMLAAVDAEAAELGWTRAELIRWIVTERYEN